MAQGIVNFTLSVSPLLGAQDRELLGQLIIEEIQDRTAGGRDVQGNRFRSYSPGYRDYLRKIGAATNPDLELTGEMINSITVLRHTRGSITIGLEPGSQASRKARYNQGGNPRIPERNFMGIRDSDAGALENQIMEDSPVVAAQRFLNENNVVDRIFAQISLGS